MISTETNYNKLKINFIKYLDQSKNIGNIFGGPSLHFHNRALSERKIEFLGNTHLEMIYATLTSWGMHRMGDTKTKMVDYKDFQKSILLNKNELINLRHLKIENIKKNEFMVLIKRLNEICFDLIVSKSNSKIVGNSKTLAHILPDLIPPIDRQYTILFFQKEPFNFIDKTGKLKQPTLKKIDENDYFNHIIEKTYDFVNFIKNNNLVKIQQPFNTSYPKIFDNLIITYIRDIKKNGV